MIKRGAILLVSVCICAAALFAGGAAGQPAQQGPYEPTSESLRAHKVPQWFEDAKFGIFIHWGVYAVPAYHEWYVEFIMRRSQNVLALAKATALGPNALAGSRIQSHVRPESLLMMAAA